MVGFGMVGRRVLQAAFGGGDIVRDGGSLLLRQADERIGLTQMAAAVSEENQMRLLLPALAYTLMINLRRLRPQGTEPERVCTATIRTKLLKVGAAVLRNTRRVRLFLASHHPLTHVFLSAARALAP